MRGLAVTGQVRGWSLRTWVGAGYSGEELGGPEQGWEDRACPLALPQREAAEDHENCPTRHLAAQFPLCPLATVEPVSGDTPGLGSPASSPYLSAGERRRKSTCSWLGPHKPFSSFLSRGSSPSCLELRKHTFVHSSISLHTSPATSPVPLSPTSPWGP